MRILVTGGAGFVGSHLTEELLRRGQSVTVLDDLSAGLLENLPRSLPSGRCEFVRGSVLDGAALRRALIGCQAIYHLAAHVGVRKLLENPRRIHDENLLGAERVSQEAARRGLPLVLASSSEVYGVGQTQPLREEEAALGGLPERPRFLYGRSKLLAEMKMAALAVRRGVPFRAVRLFNVVGPRQSDRYGMVLPTFLRQALAGAPITVFGDGRQVRCFADAEEVARSLAGLLPERQGFDSVNLGSSVPTAIGELAWTVKRLSGSPSAVVHVRPAELCGRDFEDFPRRVPDLSRLRELGVRTPSRPLETVVRRILELASVRSG